MWKGGRRRDGDFCLSLFRRVGILTAAVPSLIIVFPLLPFRLHTTGRSNGTDGGTGTLQRGGRAREREAITAAVEMRGEHRGRKKDYNAVSERAREEGQSVVINLM